MPDAAEGRPYQGPDPDKHGTGPAPRENEGESQDVNQTPDTEEEGGEDK